MHDDIILLVRPESFMVLLSCANQAFAIQTSLGLQNLNMRGKKEKHSGRGSKMTPSCKWPILTMPTENSGTLK